MTTPIYEKNTILYGNEGKYRLLKKDGNIVTYEFEPWNGEKRLDKDTLKNLSEILHMRLLWAVWEDD